MDTRTPLISAVMLEIIPKGCQKIGCVKYIIVPPLTYVKTKHDKQVFVEIFSKELAKQKGYLKDVTFKI